MRNVVEIFLKMIWWWLSLVQSIKLELPGPYEGRVCVEVGRIRHIPRQIHTVKHIISKSYSMPNGYEHNCPNNPLHRDVHFWSVQIERIKPTAVAHSLRKVQQIVSFHQALYFVDVLLSTGPCVKLYFHLRAELWRILSPESAFGSSYIFEYCDVIWFSYNHGVFCKMAQYRLNIHMGISPCDVVTTRGTLYFGVL